jgi:deoxyribodipyrimidine photo-lyase
MARPRRAPDRFHAASFKIPQGTSLPLQPTDIQPKLDELNIPLHIVSYDKRLTIPKRLVTELFPTLKTTHVFANIEYEVDELRRDIATVRLGKEKGIDVVCVHDRLVVPPGRIKSKVGKPMSVFR